MDEIDRGDIGPNLEFGPISLFLGFGRIFRSRSLPAAMRLKSNKVIE